MSRLASLARQALATLAALPPLPNTIIDIINIFNIIMVVVAIGVSVPVFTALFLDRVDHLRQRTAEVDGRPDPRTVVVVTPDPQLAALQAEVEAIKARAELQEARLLALLADTAGGCPSRP